MTDPFESALFKEKCKAAAIRKSRFDDPSRNHITGDLISLAISFGYQLYQKGFKGLFRLLLWKIYSCWLALSNLISQFGNLD